MSNSYSRYRKDRYYEGNAHIKGNWYFGLTVILLLCSLAVTFIYLKNEVKHKNTEIMKKDEQINLFKDELSWLRAINPYQGGFKNIEELAVKNRNLFPGWVARVYPVTENIGTAPLPHDVGTFVLNETKFSLASHKRYGITEQTKSMYMLNGLLPSLKKGRHQIAIKFTVNEQASVKTRKGLRKIGSCYSRFFINQKRVIDKRINFVGDRHSNDIHIGEVSLNQGIYPVTGTIYCDKDSDFMDDEIDISIMFREPDQQVLRTQRHNIYHVYKPSSSLVKS